MKRKSVIKEQIIKGIKGQKGVAREQLVIIILIVVSFAVLLLFFGKIKPLYAANYNEAMCRASIVKAWHSKQFSVTNPLGPLKKPSFPGCRTLYFIIKEDGIYDSDDVKVEDLSCRGNNCNEIVKNKILRFIAEKMADCWGLFGNTEFDYNRIVKDYYGSKATVCFVCSQVTIMPDSPINGIAPNGITYSEFSQFLKNNKLPSGETYYDFLYSKVEDNFVNNKGQVITHIVFSPTHDFIQRLRYDIGAYTFFSKLNGTTLGTTNESKIEGGKTYYVIFFIVNPPIARESTPIVLLLDNAAQSYSACERMY